MPTILSDDERKKRAYERKRRWRVNNPEEAKASVARFYARNPDARRERHLRGKYGIGLQDVYIVLELQGNGCAICRRSDPGRRSRTGGAGFWIVDHNHDTGEVRGVICHPCNIALGAVKDSVETLDSMISYLLGRVVR